MEPEGEIYVNLEELRRTLDRTEKTGSKPVWSDSVAEEETETWSPFKVAAVCLGLLCLVLLTSVVGVAVTYDQDFIQWSKDLANHTAERDQLLARNRNLTEERDQLETSLRGAELELNRMKKDSVTCPDGWRTFGCSCYLLAAERNTWYSSKQLCKAHTAELVFLNELGDNLKFWIGLSQTPINSMWTWTDGRPAGVMYWQRGRPVWSTVRTQRCAAFNSFYTGTYSMESWSSEECALYLQYVCEKEAVPSRTEN
ncbi:C-type lectin domain family 6 member A-like isoform X2 [Melanotaenia boesemani]|uniref:C-type lectin domain family 6 member A-like isoform X2 n=1 Tax=Melanotaenia boesemani TaxID=1250792 RepID=UPI001C048729|nr:C-type lectin domain family 6 member A-like isoform X2 [Melanotaenia boesemani]